MEYPINIHSHELVMIFTPFTVLGGITGSILVLALLYWLVDHKVALKIATAVVLSNIMNSLLKYMIHQPRPSGTQYDDVNGSGMPSGHAQGSMVMYGLIGMYYRKKSWVLGLCVFLPLMIGLSRVVLNVHTIEQVIVGWIVGAILMYAFYVFYENVWEPKKKQVSEPILMIIAVVILLVLFGLVLLFHESAESMHEALVTIFALAGLWLGYFLLQKFVAFGRPKDPIGGFTRVLLGLVSIGIMLFGLKTGLEALGDAGSYITYFMVGFTLSYLVPWLFEQIPLTRSKFSEDAEDRVIS